jgi:hypothetical protein
MLQNSYHLALGGNSFARRPESLENKGLGRKKQNANDEQNDAVQWRSNCPKWTECGAE